MKPNICGAVVVLHKKWQKWDVIRVLPTGDRIPAQTLEWVKNYARDNRIPLIFVENVFRDGRWVAVKRTGYGPPDFVHAVKNEIVPTDVLKF